MHNVAFTQHLEEFHIGRRIYRVGLEFSSANLKSMSSLDVPTGQDLFDEAIPLLKKETSAPWNRDNYEVQEARRRVNIVLLNIPEL